MRRIFLTALCATFLVALSAQAAMADSVTSDGTTATYTGDGGADSVSVSSTNATTVRFDDDNGDPITETGSCLEVDVDTTECTADRVVVDVLGGNDSVDASSLDEHPIEANGGDGDDTLEPGELDDEVNGQAGNDVLYGIGSSGDGGKDRLDGGDGDDGFLLPAGGDEAIGGAGIHRVLSSSSAVACGIDIRPAH